MTIVVNGSRIGEEEVARELQYHPGRTREEVAHKAATALVVRELVRQRAGALDLDCDSDEALDRLIEREVDVPHPTAEEVDRFLRRNWFRLRKPPAFEAAHIFFPAHPDDEEARAEAGAKAEAILEDVQQAPWRFADLARAHSACPSSEREGALGQVRPGETNAEVERALATMDEGTVRVVASRHGYHVLRLDRRDPGRELGQDEAHGWVAAYLRESARRRAVSQYLRLLAAQADIRGIELDLPDTPLVQ